jgi:hypothetical protein
MTSAWYSNKESGKTMRSKFFYLFMVLNIGLLTPMRAQYISSTATQAGDFIVYPGTSDNLLLRIEIEIGTDPVSLENFQFSTDGCTSANPDISKFRLYYYNDSSAFNISVAALIGTFINPWATNFTFLTPVTGNYSGLSVFNGMNIGKNYFWLTYDLTAAAKYCDTIDAAFINTVVNSISYVPVQQIPSGHSIIGSCITAFSEAKFNSDIKIMPVPATDHIKIDFNTELRNPLVVELLEISGKTTEILFKGIPDPGTSVMKFSVERFPAGIYILRTTLDGIEKYFRVIKF